MTEVFSINALFSPLRSLTPLACLALAFVIPTHRPSDIRMNEVFSAIGLQANWRGEMGLDFTQFDKTVPRNVRWGWGQ